MGSDSIYLLTFLVQTARYLLTCMRYIELNPVRAGTVRRPEEYRWSSYGAHTWGDHHWLTPHPEYQRLGTAPAGRWFAYRELFKTLLHEEDLYLVRRAAHYCQPVADDRFRQQIGERYTIKLGQIDRGRKADELIDF